MMKPSLASNREVDSGLGHALGAYVNVMCYDVWAVCDSQDPAVHASVCEAILRQELIRVNAISPTTSVISGVPAIDRVCKSVPYQRYARTVGVAFRTFVAHDVKDSPFEGTGIYFLPKEGEDQMDGDQREYNWAKDPLVGRWSTRRGALSGWENKVEFDGIQMESREDRERQLTRAVVSVLLQNEPAYVFTPPLRVRNMSVGDSQRAFIVYTSSDAVWSKLCSQKIAAALDALGIKSLSVDDYKALLSTKDSTVGSQLTDAAEAAGEGRICVVWRITDAMTEESMTAFLNTGDLALVLTVESVEIKVALSNGARYALITLDPPVDGTTLESQMNQLLSCEPAAQSLWKSQDIRFKQSRTRLERAQAKERYNTRSPSFATGAWNNTQMNTTQAAPQFSADQLTLMITELKRQMLADTVYHQQMAQCMARAMSAEFATSMGQAVATAVLQDLVQWRRDTVTELRLEFDQSLSEGLVEAADRTGVVFSHSPERRGTTRVFDHMSPSQPAPQSSSVSPVASNQQQTVPAPMNISSQVPMNGLQNVMMGSPAANPYAQHMLNSLQAQLNPQMQQGPAQGQHFG